MTPRRGALTLAARLSRGRQAKSSLEKTSILYYSSMLSAVKRAARMQQGHLTSPLQLWPRHSWQSAWSYSPPGTSAPTWSCQLPGPGSSPPSPAPAPSGPGRCAPGGCSSGSCPASADGNSKRYSPQVQELLAIFSPHLLHSAQSHPHVFWHPQGRWKPQAKPLRLQEDRQVGHVCNPSTRFSGPCWQKQGSGCSLDVQGFHGIRQAKAKGRK